MTALKTVIETALNEGMVRPRNKVLKIDIEEGKVKVTYFDNLFDREDVFYLSI